MYNDSTNKIMISDFLSPMDSPYIFLRKTKAHPSLSRAPKIN